jgi:hypothetical protein
MARRLRAWSTGYFCRKTPHVLDLHLVCDAVVVGFNGKNLINGRLRALSAPKSVLKRLALELG